MSSTEQISSSDQHLILPYGVSPEQVPYGSQIDIPQGYWGVISLGGKPCDAAPAGQRNLDAASFPRLGDRLKVKPGEMPRKAAHLQIVLIRAGQFRLRWNALPVVTRNAQYGMTYCSFKGAATLQISDPVTFYYAFQTSWQKVLKAQSKELRASLEVAPMGRQAEAFLMSMIALSVNVAVENAKFLPEQLPHIGGGLQQTLLAGVGSGLQSMGTSLFEISLDDSPEARRAPCAKCGSTTAPTAYGIYLRNISLLYVRFTAKRDGNFCVPCAAVVSASYNCTMLVCGWWGYVGIILTPAYIVQNCYHFLKTAFGAKAAAGTQVNPAPQEGDWPPPPVAAWGQEVKGNE